MRRHLTNGMTGVLDYASYPIGMLLVAPVLLKHLGTVQYGIWTIAMAAISTGGILASGFGDAHIQLIATLRGAGDQLGVKDSVRSALGLNAILGLVVALLGWLVSPMLAHHLILHDSARQATSLVTPRIACLLMLVRAVESVSISTFRAFECYVEAVRISIAGRLLSLVFAAFLASRGLGPAAILAATAMILFVATALQLWHLKIFLAGTSLLPEFHVETMQKLLSFGVYSWLQLAAGLLFGQVDRLLVGMALGAAAVTFYALVVQMAQPIYGITASSLHFLFPYLTGRMGTMSKAQLRRTLLMALGVNLALVVAGVSLLLLFGQRLLLAWAGGAVSRAASAVFPSIVYGSGLLALSVTGTHVLLALGRMRLSALIAAGSSLATIGLAWWWLPSRGVEAFAMARLAYGGLSLLVYLPLATILLQRVTTRSGEALLYSMEEAS